MFFKKSKRKTHDVAPACEKCENAAPIAGDGERFLCRIYGVVAPDHSCAKFYPDPLKRSVPPRIPLMVTVEELVADAAEIKIDGESTPKAKSKKKRSGNK